MPIRTAADRSAAAHKAWETRRTKAQFEKRSAAANKAWATRRRLAAEAEKVQTEKAARRSAAAKKAHETRRRMKREMESAAP